jgi:hypothetical protein
MFGIICEITHFTEYRDDAHQTQHIDIHPRLYFSGATALAQ